MDFDNSFVYAIKMAIEIEQDLNEKTAIGNDWDLVLALICV